MVFFDLFQFLFNAALELKTVIIVLIAVCVLATIVTIFSYMLKGKY